MPKHASNTAELRSMSAEDLQKEIKELRLEIAKKRLNVHVGSEKDTASFARAKKQLARTLTVLKQVETSALNKEAKTSTMPARAQKKSKNDTGSDSATA